jgi:predicted ATPase
MYLSVECILAAMEKLRSIHPFFGITFLSCKANALHVGASQEYSMDSNNKLFMNMYHRLDPLSAWYYQPYRSNSNTRFWVRFDYPSSGLQALNTQTFRNAFLHEPKTWGWQNDYVSILEGLLNQNKKSAKLPIAGLAIWLFRNVEWKSDVDVKHLTECFLSTFKITRAERECLFVDDTCEFINSNIQLLQDNCITWDNLRCHITPPPDAEPDRGASLSFLNLVNVGPAVSLTFEPGSRLNIITGDNGLGKSFLMECAWWALTGKWADAPAIPFGANKGGRSLIEYAYANAKKHDASKSTSSFDPKLAMWSRKEKLPSVPGLIVYARVDGSYAVWEPIRQDSYVFSRTDVWDGMDKDIEGLIRDWVRWQSTPGKYPFDKLMHVLKRISPPDMGELQSGEPTRMLSDAREIPTIIHPYGAIPITHTSAGVRRIVTLAYLIVWAWYEHTTRANLTETTAERRMVILVDELEAHLHPKWQRTILPALTDIQSLLADELNIQFIISTHSPLVLASAETVFDEITDKLFNMFANEDTGFAELEEKKFIKYGRVDSWLTSPIFNLNQARSQQAEEAINKAKEIQIEKEPAYDDISDTHQLLLRTLAETDPFWSRWLYFAESNGIEI